MVYNMIGENRVKGVCFYHDMPLPQREPQGFRVEGSVCIRGGQTDRGLGC